MIYLDKFNDTFKEFLDDLIRIFPDDSDFRLYEIILNTALNNDKLLVINVFNKYVTEAYGEKILQKDDEFFMTHTYDHLLNKNNAEYMIEKIKSYWTQMDDETKDIVWKYFRVLILLDKKYRSD